VFVESLYSPVANVLPLMQLPQLRVRRRESGFDDGSDLMNCAFDIRFPIHRTRGILESLLAGSSMRVGNKSRLLSFCFRNKGLPSVERRPDDD
jgi:hypothetical protein